MAPYTVEVEVEAAIHLANPVRMVDLPFMVVVVVVDTMPVPRVLQSLEVMVAPPFPHLVAPLHRFQVGVVPPSRVEHPVKFASQCFKELKFYYGNERSL
jgi:hypothetical protein